MIIAPEWHYVPYLDNALICKVYGMHIQYTLFKLQIANEFAISSSYGFKISRLIQSQFQKASNIIYLQPHHQCEWIYFWHVTTLRSTRLLHGKRSRILSRFPNYINYRIIGIAGYKTCVVLSLVPNLEMALIMIT
jgi:hypothetical protein